MANTTWLRIRCLLNLRHAFVAVWLVGLLLVAYCGVNTLARMSLALAKMPWLYGTFVVLVSLKTLLLLLISGAMWMVALVMRRCGWDGWPLRLRYNLLLVAIMAGLMLSLSLVGAAMSPDPYVNRFGFYPPYGLNVHTVNRSGRPGIPDAEVTTNDLGYRDQDWAPAKDPNTRRALLVGDSFVYGQGIADQNATLDNALERELEARSGQPWEVINIAILPSALPYYSQSLLQIGQEALPDILVMSFLNNADMEPLDLPMVKHRMPKVLVGCLEDFDVFYDIMAAGYLYTHWNVGERFPGSEESLRPGFDALLEWMKSTRTPLLIWWPMDKSNPFFDGYPQGGLLHHLVNRLRGPIGLPHFYPGDGHPTPEGNRHIAGLVADAILRILNHEQTVPSP